MNDLEKISSKIDTLTATVAKLKNALDAPPMDAAMDYSLRLAKIRADQDALLKFNALHSDLVATRALLDRAATLADPTLVDPAFADFNQFLADYRKLPNVPARPTLENQLAKQGFDREIAQARETLSERMRTGIDEMIVRLSVKTGSGVTPNDEVAANRAIDERPESKPTFNHTRGDSSLDPCPVCLPLLSRSQLIALLEDTRAARDFANEFVDNKLQKAEFEVKRPELCGSAAELSKRLETALDQIDALGRELNAQSAISAKMIKKREADVAALSDQLHELKNGTAYAQLRVHAFEIAKSAAKANPPTYYTGDDFEPHDWVVEAVMRARGLARNWGEEKILTLAAQLERMTKERDEVQARFDVADDHVDELTKQRDELNDQLSSAKKLRSASDAELHRALDQRDHLSVKVNDLSKEANELDARLIQALSQRNHIQDRLRESESELADVNDRHDKLTNKVFELERVARDLALQVRDADDLSTLMIRVINAAELSNDKLSSSAPVKFTSRGAVEWLEGHATKLRQAGDNALMYLAQKKELDQAKFDYGILEQRIQTIADEAAGPEAVQTGDDNLTRIEKAIAAQLDECQRLELEKARERNRADDTEFKRVALDMQLQRVREAVR